jgi:hypothetical protein
MSEVKRDPNENVWAPPSFPVSGRLPSDIKKVAASYGLQYFQVAPQELEVNEANEVLVRLGGMKKMSISDSFFILLDTNSWSYEI